jgi:hypothetical protein
MPMSPFMNRFPDLAAKETRVATILGDAEIPKGEYAFVEWYCDEDGCDCRRVMIQVIERSTKRKVWASINYGWEKPGYYVKWVGSPSLAKDMAGAILDPINPQSECAPALLEIFETILQDPDYVERLKRHYAMFKGTQPPRSRSWETRDPSWRSKRPKLGPKKKRKRPR